MLCVNNCNSLNKALNQKHCLDYFTCDVEEDLDLLVSGGASESPVPPGAILLVEGAVLLHAAAELLGAGGEARLKVGVILVALRTPAVAPTSWC